MTKRAWIVIGIIVLIPVLITGIVLIRWKIDNPVVATYGDSVNEVHYGEKTLYAVGDPEEYMAEPGNFLGKVGKSMTGAPFYTVKYDKTGEIWALVTEKGTVLYTESGALPPSAYGGTQVTALFFDRFADRVTDKTQLSVLVGIIGSSVTPVTWKQTEEEEAPVSYRLHVCYDGSAVSTVSPGTLLYFKESGLWYYLSAAEEERVDALVESGEMSAGKETYSIVPITGGAEIRLLKALLREGDASDVVIPSSAIKSSATKSGSSAVQSGAVSSAAVASGAVSSAIE